MARRPNIIKKQQKIQKKTKSEQYLINRKYLGDEPVFDSAQMTKSAYSNHLQWYNSMCSLGEAKDYLVDYLRSKDRITEAEKVLDVPDKWIPTTVAWIARMLSRGASLQPASISFFESRLKECLSRDYRATQSDGQEEEGGNIPPKEKATQRPSVQDRMKSKLSEFICGVEEIIDEFHDNKYSLNFSMYDHLKANEIPPVQAKRVFDFYNPQLLEIEEAYNGVPEVLEGYANYSKQNLEKLYDFFVLLVEDTERYMSNEKKVRKPRTPKPITAEKKLKDFKYMNAFAPLKLQSVRPEMILGCGELWAFNTKYNQLTVFRMLNPSGLDVYRTSITNFDETQSITKKLRAKDVQSVLQNVLTGGKIVLRNLMRDTAGSTQKLQERMNENTILLRVVPK